MMSKCLQDPKCRCHPCTDRRLDEALAEVESYKAIGAPEHIAKFAEWMERAEQAEAEVSYEKMLRKTAERMRDAFGDCFEVNAKLRDALEEILKTNVTTHPNPDRRMHTLAALALKEVK